MNRVLFLSLLLTSSLVKGQTPQSMLYLSRKEIKNKLTQLYDCTYLGPSKIKGATYDSYHQNNGSDAISCFFNKAGLCYEVDCLKPYKELSNDIKQLNDNFINIKQFKWKTKSDDMLIEVLPTQDRGLYLVRFKDMYLSQ
ncbi:MAG TPA: hypothetical protein VIM55_17505 [Mucilaginibacter sp.]